MRVGIFGGSFNPPHVGHVLAATYALCQGEVDLVLVVPTFCHPFGKSLAGFQSRYEMSKLAFEWLPGVQVSDIENTLPTPSRTLNTVEALLGRHPEWQLRLIMGADLLHEAERWFAFDRLREVAPPLVIGRSGYPSDSDTFLDLPKVSSSYLRELTRQQDWGGVRRLTHFAVAEYIIANGLYQDRP